MAELVEIDVNLKSPSKTQPAIAKRLADSPKTLYPSTPEKTAARQEKAASARKVRLPSHHCDRWSFHAFALSSPFQNFLVSLNFEFALEMSRNIAIACFPLGARLWGNCLLSSDSLPFILPFD